MPAERAYGYSGAARAAPTRSGWGWVADLPTTPVVGAPVTSGWGWVADLPPATPYAAPAPRSGWESVSYDVSAPRGGGGGGGGGGGYGAPANQQTYLPAARAGAGARTYATMPTTYGGAAVGYAAPSVLTTGYQQRAYGWPNLGNIYAGLRQNYGDWMDLLQYITDPEERNAVNMELGKAMTYGLAGRRYSSPNPLAQMILEGRMPSNRLLSMSPLGTAPAYLGAQAGAQMGEFYRQQALSRPEIAGAPALVGTPQSPVLPLLADFAGNLLERSAPIAAPQFAPAPGMEFVPMPPQPGQPGFIGPVRPQPAPPTAPSLLDRLGAVYRSVFPGSSQMVPPSPAPPTAPPLPAPAPTAPRVGRTPAPTATAGAAPLSTYYGGGGGGGGGGQPSASVQGIPDVYTTWFESIFGPVASYYTLERGGLDQMTRDYQSIQALWLQLTGTYLTPEQMPGVLMMVRSYLGGLGRAPTMSDVLGYLRQLGRNQPNPPQVSYLNIGEI